MKRLFENKVVIITGASSGIGEATAREFAANRSKVMLAARSEDKLKSIVAGIRVQGLTASGTEQGSTPREEIDWIYYREMSRETRSPLK